MNNLQRSAFPEGTSEELDASGIIQMSGESREDFQCRVIRMKNTQKRCLDEATSELMNFVTQSIPKDSELQVAANHITWDLFKFQLEWCPVCYSTKQTGFFSAGILFEIDNTFPIIFLNEGLQNEKKLHGYSAEETLAHELIHAARTGRGASVYEELFCCMASKSIIRRTIGNFFRKWYIPAVFFISISFAWIGFLYAWAPPAMIILREIWLRVQLSRAKHNLFNAGFDPLPVLFRLEDNEIKKWAKSPCPIPDDTFWKTMTARFAIKCANR